MSFTIDDSGWIAEASGIYWPNGTFGPFAPGQPRWIVLHGTAFDATATDLAISWSNQSEAGTLQACTHLIIDKNGECVQGLSLKNTAWGNSGASDSPRASWLPTTTNLNMFTISIEHVKYDSNDNDILTSEQRTTSFAVIKAICEKYDIPKNVILFTNVSQGGIIRHADCDQKYRAHCPGPYPFADLQNFLNGGPSMFSDELCIEVWESKFRARGTAIPQRDRGIFDMWRNDWRAGHFRGAPDTDEMPAKINGKPGVIENFGSNTAWWIDANTNGWL